MCCVGVVYGRVGRLNGHAALWIRRCGGFVGVVHLSSSCCCWHSGGDSGGMTSSGHSVCSSQSVCLGGRWLWQRRLSTVNPGNPKHSLSTDPCRRSALFTSSFLLAPLLFVHRPRWWVTSVVTSSTLAVITQVQQTGAAAIFCLRSPPSHTHVVAPFCLCVPSFSLPPTDRPPADHQDRALDAAPTVGGGSGGGGRKRSSRTCRCSSTWMPPRRSTCYRWRWTPPRPSFAEKPARR